MMTFILFSGTAEKKRYGFDFISINFSILNAKGKLLCFPLSFLQSHFLTCIYVNRLSETSADAKQSSYLPCIELDGEDFMIMLIIEG